MFGADTDDLLTTAQHDLYDAEERALTSAFRDARGLIDHGVPLGRCYFG